MLFIITLISLYIAVKFGVFAGIITSLAMLYFFRNKLVNESTNIDNKKFIQDLFGLFGNMAKAKGRVEKADLDAAIQLMRILNINDSEDIKIAKTAFNMGKNPDFSFEKTLLEIKQEFHNNSDMRKLVLDVLISASLIDGCVQAEERKLLNKACQILNYSQIYLNNMINAHLNQAFNHSSSQNNNYYSNNTDANTLETAYAILELNKNATQNDTKKQYKRMMSKNHPDKLIAKGLPKHLIEAAKEKTQRINQAYDLICKVKGW